MAVEEQESGRGFRVQDRRRFASDTGESCEETEARNAEDSARKEPANESRAPAGEPQRAQDPVHEPISFSSFLLGLITQALMLMGEIASVPGQGQQVDLLAARQMIDLLALLQEKTKGNLDPAEETMLENALFDLRMRYVDAAKRG
ncbi:MAG: DUF1844 domain-containing protein [Deltaproteobacteria bacterium]|nr:DUF1844 domain-containing protein [Deltaproteobacteria bacterium]